MKVTFDQYSRFVKQINALVNLPGGVSLLAEAIFKGVSGKRPPLPPVDTVDDLGNEVKKPAVDRDVPDLAGKVLFDESGKSIWYLINVHLGKVSARVGYPLGQSTRDEVRILKSAVSNLPDSRDKDKLMKRLVEVEERTKPYTVPDIGV